MVLDKSVCVRVRQRLVARMSERVTVFGREIPAQMLGES